MEALVFKNEKGWGLRGAVSVARKVSTNAPSSSATEGHRWRMSLDIDFLLPSFYCDSFEEALALLQRDDKGNRRYTFAELMMRLSAQESGFCSA